MQDALSDVLALLEMRSLRCTRLEASGAWSWHFPANPIVKFVAVLKGECWIVLDGRVPQPLAAGDTFLLADAPGYVVTSDPGLPADDGIAAFDWTRSNVARHQGDDTVMLGGGFVLEGGDARLLLDMLPDVLLLPATPVLHGSLMQLAEELRAGKMGMALLTRRLAEILLVQALRVFAEREDVAPCWLSALKDPRLSAAINRMHGAPGHRWALRELALCAGMSRSSFVSHFKAAVGLPPMDYLRRWRMEKACVALRQRQVPLAVLAEELGFSSESAFGNAFKRQYGQSPRAYRERERREGS